MSDQKEVNPKHMRELVARYENGLLLGKYYVKAVVTYDGKEIVIEDTFEVGNLLVELTGIYVKQFRLGEIAKFDILIESKWNEPIADVFADMEIKDKGKSLTRFKTSEVDLDPYAKEVLNAYWDTADVSIGTYRAKVTLHFLGKNLEKEMTLNVREDAIDIDFMPTAMAIDTPEPSKRDSYIIILVALSIIVNITLFIIFARRKRDRTN